MHSRGEFVWNEDGVVQLPAPYITLWDLSLYFWYITKEHSWDFVHPLKMELKKTKNGSIDCQYSKDKCFKGTKF